MLSRLHRRLAWLVVLPLVLTGLLQLVLHEWFPVEGEFGTQPHPLESWMLGLHGATAMGFLLLLGSLLPSHVARLWARGRNRRTGLAMSLSCAALILSGWGLYYLGDESWRLVARWLHIVLGLTIPFGVVVHVIVGRRSRQPTRRERRRLATRGVEAKPRPVVPDYAPAK